MDTALASVLCVAIVGFTTVIIKSRLVKGNHSEHRHITLETQLATLTAVSQQILGRLERIENKLDNPIAPT